MPPQVTSGKARQPYKLDAGEVGWLAGTTITGGPDSTPLLHYFGGIPYALPPVGQYRFRRARKLPEHYRYGTKVNPGHFARQTAICPQPGFRSSPNPALWDENCLQLNIYIPAEQPPDAGWPVFFYIHGGFLQWGHPNFNPEYVAPLLSETAFKAIIVAPAYRVNVFGFIASSELQAEAKALSEPSSNQGFFDQRLALEWTSQHIGAFAGNKNNITIGGYSAGSHSVFHQLAHELYFVSDKEAIIKRAIMWSNSPGVQPKTVSEQQKQFDELLLRLNIPAHLSAKEKLHRLRSKTALEIVEANDKMKLSEFRATSDDVFVSKDLISNINSGDFGRRMKARGVWLMNGECQDEHHLYRAWRTPPDSFDAVYQRLCADYPEQAVRSLIRVACGEQKALPVGCKDWSDAFGKLYANMQVHCLERGFHRALFVKSGLVPGHDLLRYRIEWRAKCMDGIYPIEWGVTHATDMAIWFWGLDYGDGLTDDEKKVLKPWNEAFAAFVKGDPVKWSTSKITDVMRLRSDGMTDIWEDDRWSEGLKVWDAVNDDSAPGLLGWLKSKL